MGETKSWSRNKECALCIWISSIQILVPFLTTFVILDKLYSLSVPQLPYL